MKQTKESLNKTETSIKYCQDKIRNSLNYNPDKARDSMLLSGQTLYLKEHTEATKRNTKAIYVIGLLFFGLIVFLLLYIHYYNVWGNTIRIIGGC